MATAEQLSVELLKPVNSTHPVQQTVPSNRRKLLLDCAASWSVWISHIGRTTYSINSTLVYEFIKHTKKNGKQGLHPLCPDQSDVWIHSFANSFLRFQSYKFSKS